jgi:hypothetical protein
MYYGFLFSAPIGRKTRRKGEATMSSPIYQVLRNAILTKQNISADYKNYRRIMTPHTLGQKAGKEKCLLYQFAGESSSTTVFPENSPANWRCVFVDELINVTVVGGPIHTCERHTQNQTCVDHIDVELVV